MPFGVNATGLEMPTASDYLLLIRLDFEERLAARGLPAPVWERDTFLGPLTAVMAVRLEALSDDVIQIDAGYDPNNAVGLQLDNIVALIAITRREATRSTAPVTFVATIDGIVIPENSVLEDTNKNRWRTTESVTIAGFAGATTAEALERGATPASTGIITKIVTPIDGWSSVTNTTGSVGDARETDTELRRRRLISLQRGTTATVAGILASVFDLEWTTAVTTVDNPANTIQVVEGITMPRHSVATVVYPSTPTAAQITELAEALSTSVPAGIEQVGSESESVTIGIVEKSYFWQYASSVSTDVTVVATALAGYDTSEIEAQMEDFITDYFLALDVGDGTKELPLCALFATITGLDILTSISYDDGTTVGPNIDRTATEIAIEGAVSVTVT